LQSRLNNDVISAQQAVTTTLGTVVSNVINLAVVLTIMLRLEWRLTLLTLIVLPAFIIPARRIGPRMQRLTREGMQLNAEMNNLTVERFNVAGALLAKLFEKRDAERDRFATRAAGVVTSACAPRSTVGSCSSRSGSSPRSAPRSSTSSAATSPSPARSRRERSSRSCSTSGRCTNRSRS
jgi:ABC-type multidrug transport system, ATPase and permease components